MYAHKNTIKELDIQCVLEYSCGRVLLNHIFGHEDMCILRNEW